MSSLNESETASLSASIPSGSVAMRPSAWCGEPYFTPKKPTSTFYKEVSEGFIDLVKVGKASWVVTSHQEYWSRRRAFNEANKPKSAA